MATLTQARRSTVALKTAMALSGLVMLGYVLVHMYGNLKYFNGAEEFDEYLHGLRSIGYPYLPEDGFIWLLRLSLLTAVIVHAVAAVVLWRRARSAAAVHGAKRYYSKQNKRGVQRSYASFTMRWGGIVLALFIVYHVLHFTAMTVQPGIDSANESKHAAMAAGFSLWYVTLGYAVAIVALGLHLRHGFWSALATLGANSSPARRRQLSALALFLAVAISVGFLVPPLAIFFGWA